MINCFMESKGQWLGFSRRDIEFNNREGHELLDESVRSRHEHGNGILIDNYKLSCPIINKFID